MLRQISIIWKVQRHPVAMFAVIGCLLVFALSGYNRLQLDVDFSDYFVGSDPRLTALNSMTEQFERHDKLWMLLESDNDWRDSNEQQALKAFLVMLNNDPNISSVSGYSQFVLGMAKTEKILSYKAHPRLSSVLSADGHAILLQLQLDSSKVSDFATQSLWLNALLTKLDNTSHAYWQPLNVRVHFNGTHALNWQYAKVLIHDLSWFAPALLGIIFLMALLFIRQKAWVLALTLNNVITLLLTLGVAAWFKLTLAAISAFIPVIIVTLGLAYGSHLYFGWRSQLTAGVSVAEALRYTVKVNQAPLFYSSITTIFGFSLLTLSPSPPIQSFGILVAFAVLCNYLLCLTSLIFFAKFSTPTSSQILNFDKVVDVAKYNARQPKAVIGGILLLSALALVSVSKLTLNDDPLSYFESSTPFSLSSQKMAQYFSGINLQHYVVSSLRDSQIDKTEISFIYKFSRYLKKQPEVIKVQHIGDWIKAAGIGQTQFRQLLSQNNVNQLGLASELAKDKRASLVTLYLQPMTAKELIRFERKVDAWLAAQNLNVGVSQSLGSNLLFAHLSVDNANNMLLSFAAALIALAVLLSVLKGSLIYGVIGLLLNFLPLLWVFALWQLNGGFISLGTAVVLAMMLGIIVDDTLHLMLKLPNTHPLRFNSENKGIVRASADSLWLSLQQVLPVISFTTLTIAMGFSIGLLSEFAPISQLSLLSCLVVIFAWGFDVLMLPVLYLWWLVEKSKAMSVKLKADQQ
ncbi:efflux RND transporter permease subunit [Shewanella fidelis]|uniref:efflux RND transporter permease subunit n=1 Tax=Shewanella fidelis TaxID=173509 RepID=UPI0004B0F462|nr:MMPL family transporter [Shewanella fidelis]